MDETSLLEYDKSLQELEQQRQSLELVMERMGAEWEESGAGIGWIGELSRLNSDSIQFRLDEQKLVEPSHHYLQTLLNVNEKLLEESLATTSDTLFKEDIKINKPNPQDLITPTTLIDDSQPFLFNTQLTTPPTEK